MTQIRTTFNLILMWIRFVAKTSFQVHFRQVFDFVLKNCEQMCRFNFSKLSALTEPFWIDWKFSASAKMYIHIYVTSSICIDGVFLFTLYTTIVHSSSHPFEQPIKRPTQNLQFEITFGLTGAFIFAASVILIIIIFILVILLSSE